MKVIVNNNSIKVECPHCTSLLAVCCSDIVYRKIFGHGSDLYIICVACSQRINLEYNFIPEKWKKQIFIDDEDDDF